MTNYAQGVCKTTTAGDDITMEATALPFLLPLLRGRCKASHYHDGTVQAPRLARQSAGDVSSAQPKHREMRLLSPGATMGAGEE